MKYFLIILFSLVAFALSSQNIHEVWENLAITELTKFKEKVFFLEIGENASEQLIFDLKEIMLKHNYKISQRKSSTKLKVNIVDSEKEVPKISFWGKKRQQETNGNIYIEILENDILVFTIKKDFQIKSSEIIQTKMKWYDPLFVSVILSGLVYLFYYGN